MVIVSSALPVAQLMVRVWSWGKDPVTKGHSCSVIEQTQAISTVSLDLDP